MTSSEERELREILIAANSGEATDQQLERLDEMLRTEPETARYCAKLLDQQAALAWQANRLLPPSELRRDAPSAAIPEPRRSSDATPSPHSHWSHFSLWTHYGVWSALAATVAFIAGTIAATHYWNGDRLAGRGALAPPGAVADGRDNHGRTPYEAQLVRSTACRWDHASAASRSVGSLLTSGESLDLLEGLADIDMSWSTGGTAELSLEGPAAMMLNSDGMPTLRFGKLTASISSPQRPFILETPVGRLMIADHGSIGVAAFGNDAEVHVFGGAATLDPAWQSPDRNADSVKISAGESLRIQTGPNGEMVVERRAAEQASFVAQVSMTSDALVVTPSYVKAIKASKPIGYWRLEGDAWPRIPNEMGDRFECHVNGSIGRTGRPGSEAIEFGVTDQGGDVVCSEVFDDVIGESYSLEMWVKPSHYHVGAMISLVGDTLAPSGIIPHGMLLELGGSGKIPRAVHHPGRIRFLHRSPASNSSELGTSCYSTDAYTLRRWQHVVAVKEGPLMRLYINGELVGQGEDTNELPSGLRLLIGRLYPSRNARPFIGQLDELAIYNRALSSKEILQHYLLLRPQSAPSKSI